MHLPPAEYIIHRSISNEMYIIQFWSKSVSIKNTYNLIALKLIEIEFSEKEKKKEREKNNIKTQIRTVRTSTKD